MTTTGGRSHGKTYSIAVERFEQILLWMDEEAGEVVTILDNPSHDHMLFRDTLLLALEATDPEEGLAFFKRIEVKTQSGIWKQLDTEAMLKINPDINDVAFGEILCQSSDPERDTIHVWIKGGENCPPDATLKHSNGNYYFFASYDPEENVSELYTFNVSPQTTMHGLVSKQRMESLKQQHKLEIVLAKMKYNDSNAD